jgi:hypothetical protein
MNKKLISLEDANTVRFLKESRVPTKNGIACPKCNKELSDANDGIVLYSDPLKINILCEYCDYTGYRCFA